MKTVFTALITATIIFSNANAQSVASVETGSVSEAKTTSPNVYKFEMKEVKHGYLITWEASNQFNTAWYELQISEDNNRFSTVKRRTCGTQKRSRYQAVLENTIILAHPIHYRLKMVSLDGAVSYTESKTIEEAEVAK
ncbi:MAG: hypothetical protein V4685_01260 [Bacteroidota bacterium]